MPVASATTDELGTTTIVRRSISSGHSWQIWSNISFGRVMSNRSTRSSTICPSSEVTLSRNGTIGIFWYSTTKLRSSPHTSRKSTCAPCSGWLGSTRWPFGALGSSIVTL